MTSTLPAGTDHRHYRLIEKAIAHLAQPNDAHCAGVLPTTLASSLGVSTAHLQRTFKEWAGVTPQQFAALLSPEHTLKAISTAPNPMDAALSADLSGPGRLHDFRVKLVAATPSEIKQEGRGLTLEWEVVHTPFGSALCAQTPKAICSMQFLHEGFDQAAALERLTLDWPLATVHCKQGRMQPLFDSLFDPSQARPNLHVWVKASDFRLKVWRTLLEAPEGTLLTYGQLARQCHNKRAARAVGSAVAANPVGWIIPCHRVIRENGDFGQYRWQTARKKAMHVWEARDRA